VTKKIKETVKSSVSERKSTCPSDQKLVSPSKYQLAIQVESDEN